MQSYNNCSLQPLFADFKPPDAGKKMERKKKIFLAVGTAILVSSLVFMILGILRWKGYLGGKTSREQGNLAQMY
jgi:hypothetical protein